MDAHEIATQYILLALRIGRHVPDFVDGYYGPPELRERAAAGDLPDLAALADDAGALLDAIAGAGLDPQREHFLTGQTVAMQTVVRQLRGEQLALPEETQLLFDVVPERVPESEFDAALAEIDRALPGPGPLIDRVAAWKRGFELPLDRVGPALDLAHAEVRRRAQALFTLPPRESVEVGLVTDKPWSGYNWYLGDLRSRVEINVDLPLQAYRVPDLMAHEGYPGHHTEHAIKEYRLVRQAGRLEQTILLLDAPECLLSEGIATVALDVIFPEAELAAWLAGEFYPACGLPGADVDQALAVSRALRGLRGVSGNAAFLLYVDRRPEAEILHYFRHYGLDTEAEARHGLRFISQPRLRSYIFTYFYGQRLVRQYIARGETAAAFGRLLAEPMMPSDLRAG